MFSYEFCEIPKNIFFTEHRWATASVCYNLKVPLKNSVIIFGDIPL